MLKANSVLREATTNALARKIEIGIDYLKRLGLLLGMKIEFKPIAERIVNAENAFIANIQNLSGCSKVEAEKVFQVYRKAKILKNDFINGVINVKHGAFLDVSTIRNAIAS